MSEFRSLRYFRFEIESDSLLYNLYFVIAAARQVEEEFEKY